MAEIIGDDEDNDLTGGADADVILGRGGNDTLSGEGGNDTIQGHAGDDVLYGGDGADALYGDFDYLSNDPAFGNDTLYGGAGDDFLNGGLGADVMFGGDGDDFIRGTDGDTLNGDAGDDVLAVNGIPIALHGGTGWDELHVQFDGLVSAGINLDLSAQWTGGVGSFNGGAVTGIDHLVDFRGSYLDDILIVGAAGHVGTVSGNGGNDQLTLTDEGTFARGGVGNDVINGLGGNDTLLGQQHDDILNGGDGDDFLDGDADSVASELSSPRRWPGVDILNGGAGDDTIIGGADGDTVNGGDGADKLFAGRGDSVDGGDGDDRLEIRGATALLDGGAGTDTAIFDFRISTVAYTLDMSGVFAGGSGELNGATVRGIESVTQIWGSHHGDTIVLGADAPAVTVEMGSGADALTLTGGADTAHGRFGDDTILGLAGDDTLQGGDGDDYLDGGAGADVMYGGWNDDIFVVDDAGDRVFENADEGSDVIRSWISYTLTTANIERVELMGDAELSVTGDGLANVLVGNSAGNVLDGGAGADWLEGGEGHDTYIVDNVGDRVIELFGGGSDYVFSSVSFSLAGQDIEAIELTGDQRLNAAGNALDNLLIGNSATNGLSGGAGADRMEGGDGSDVYTVDNVGDVVVELENQGTDLVKAGVTWTLGANVENLWLLTNRQINAIGNELNNTIVGNARANVIIGMGGRDLMTGGGGTDRFDFRAVSDSSWAAFDRITDLEDGDVINLTLIDADTTTAGNQAFVLADAFTGVAGQLVLTYVASGDFTQLAADVNGDGVGDFRVILNGDHADYTNFRL